MTRRRKILIICLCVILLLSIAFGVYFLGYYLPETQRIEEHQRLMREYYESKLELYTIQNGEYDDYEVDVAFLGDSLTDGCDLPLYYPDLVASNRGIGGDTTFGLENRLQTSLYDLKPKVAVMLIGGNNLDTMLDNYERILIDIRQNLPDTRVVLVSLTAMGGYHKGKNELAAYNNVTISKLAAKYGYTFVDVFTPLFDEQTGEIYSHYTTDGVHLTPAGYRVLTDAISPAIMDCLVRN